MMKLEELKIVRNNLVSTKQLFDSEGILLPKPKHDNVNCYLYALGLRSYDSIMELTGSFYQNPGFTVDYGWYLASCDKLCITDILNGVKRDLENLQMTYKQINIGKTVALNQNEFLIKAFYLKGDRFVNPDFHFIRFDPISKVWFSLENMTYTKILSTSEDLIDTSSVYENDPKCYVKTISGLKLLYRPIGYFAIKEIQK